MFSTFDVKMVNVVENAESFYTLAGGLITFPIHNTENSTYYYKHYFLVGPCFSEYYFIWWPIEYASLETHFTSSLPNQSGTWKGAEGFPSK